MQVWQRIFLLTKNDYEIGIRKSMKVVFLFQLDKETTIHTASQHADQISVVFIPKGGLITDVLLYNMCL